MLISDIASQQKKGNAVLMALRWGKGELFYIESIQEQLAQSLESYEAAAHPLRLRTNINGNKYRCDI